MKVMTMSALIVCAVSGCAVQVGNEVGQSVEMESVYRNGMNGSNPRGPTYDDVVTHREFEVLRDDMRDRDEAMEGRIDELKQTLRARERELAEIRSAQGRQQTWLVCLALVVALAYVAVPVVFDRIERRMDRNGLD